MRVSRVLGLMAFVSLALVGFTQAPGPGDWLEASTPVNWNAPGSPVPAAPPASADIDPRCAAQERPPESPEEEQVVAAGWRLFNAARVGWGLRVIDGLVDYDGMCRPNQFQGFVFADGQFAGTISPAPMDSRTDGAGRVQDVRGGQEITAQYVRYTPADPLCCPSSTFFVQFSVDRGGDAPVLVPVRSTRINARSLEAPRGAPTPPRLDPAVAAGPAGPTRA